MKIIKLSYGLIIIVLLSIIFLSNESHFNPINNQDRNEAPAPAQSQFSENSLTVNQNFSIIEVSENSETRKNVSSIDVDLGTSRWNITNIKINVTDMYFKNETKTIEDTQSYYFTLSKTAQSPYPNPYHCLSVEMEILAPTILYGVQIYGINETAGNVSPLVYFQIQGANKNKGIPNGTIIASSSIKLNMSYSTTPTWHLQKFPTPINLNTGFYFLVINGSTMASSGSNKYRWWFCDSYSNPDYPYLNISCYIKSSASWTLGQQTPFLYKMIQKISSNFYPKQINMTAKINGIDRIINNGNKIGSGNLSLPFNKFFPNVSILPISVKNNISEALIFNLSYYIKLNNSLICGGTVLIKDSLENKWIIEPSLERFGKNYTVSYKYPKTWKNITVYKDSNKLTENNYTINQYTRTLTILNNTISNPPLSSWLITANSTFFELTLPVTQPDEFEAGKDIGFIINNPKRGDYTFVLIDKIGIKRFENFTTYSPPGDLNFNWTLPTTSISGEWSAYFFWDNHTDAGAEIHGFTVSGGIIITENVIISPTSDGGGNGKTKVTGLDPFVVYMTILIIGIVSASSFTSYATVKRIKKTRDIRRKQLFDKVTNILNLSHIIIIDKNSGLNIYQEFYGGKNLDTTLVSGFLDAIRSFGIELTSARTQSQIISLEYQDSKILMAEFKNFRLILIMGEKASEEFLKAITNLSYDIDTNFGEELKNFKGDVVKFRDIRSLIEKNLNTAFVYPLNVFEPKDVKLNPSERAMILKAKKFMKENNLNYFFTSFLLSEQNLNPKDIEIMFKLLDKKIFQPIELTSNIK